MRKNTIFSFLSSFFQREIFVCKTPVLSAKNRGQAMTEYVLIIALIALAGLGVAVFWGEALSSAYEGLCIFMMVPVP